MSQGERGWVSQGGVGPGLGESRREGLGLGESVWEGLGESRREGLGLGESGREGLGLSE